MQRSIVHIAGEMAPLVKVGGLADVAGALSLEQARAGHRVTVALPAYSTMQVPAGWKCRELGGCDVPWGMGVEPARFDVLELDPARIAGGVAAVATVGAGVRVGSGGAAAVDGPGVDTPPGALRVLRVRHAGDRKFFDRAGIYDDPKTGEGYADNPERFLFFCRAALEGLARMGERFDVIHAHDHQAGWAPCFVRTHEAYRTAFDGTATVFTIHNLGYQGLYDSWVLALAGFGGEVFYAGGPFEYWGRVNYMKVGIAFADMLSTVSPKYAEEIQSSGEFGFGLEGVLTRRRADLRGILNGIDVDYWNPATDAYLPAHYDADRLDGKAQVRAALVKACGFANDALPIVGIVSRLAEQKGFDLIEEVAEDLVGMKARFVVLGAGTPRYVELLRGLAFEHPDRFAYRAGFDEAFAHLIEGGADMFLMPSRYEPCGLNQMYSMRYGTVPVVRATGGLADTVTEFDPMTRQGTGFTFQRFDAAEMLGAIRRAMAIHREPELWRALQRNGMAQDFSWAKSAREYDALYDEARKRVAAGSARTLEKVRASI